MSTSAAGEKLPPAITQKVLKPMERAQAWAGRQLNKAQQMIRELSVSHPDPRDIALQVQASDNNFFEHITQPLDVDQPAEDELLTIRNLTLNVDRKELEALYVEALYTITHKVGKEECESRENLYKYVRSAFQGDTQLHNTLMEKAKQNKPPVVLLNVLLLEAKDLIAKDVNGFSDPFTMMGVVPGKREIPEVIESNEEENPKSPRNQLKRDSVLHRFGGSFRRKPGKKGSTMS
ncbi:hypothetical protein Q1695_001072 [Nippostrongylus brasiliensis]|nr:hypothetical protein Q1695_001072 [Nippostrongylus brasiliensis]